jgi:hypothetical protein
MFVRTRFFFVHQVSQISVATETNFNLADLRELDTKTLAHKFIIRAIAGHCQNKDKTANIPERDAPFSSVQWMIVYTNQNELTRGDKLWPREAPHEEIKLSWAQLHNFQVLINRNSYRVILSSTTVTSITSKFLEKYVHKQEFHRALTNRIRYTNI